MDPLALGSTGRCPVTFTLHLRAPDPEGRATTGPVIGDTYRGVVGCTTWITLELCGKRAPRVGVEETVWVEPTPQLRPEDGPAMWRCAARALATLPPAFLCDPQDREELGENDPQHLMAFLELSGYEALVAILGYYALGFGAAYPFMSQDPERAKVKELLEGLSEFPTRFSPV